MTLDGNKSTGDELNSMELLLIEPTESFQRRLKQEQRLDATLKHVIDACNKDSSAKAGITKWERTDYFTPATLTRGCV